MIETGIHRTSSGPTDSAVLTSIHLSDRHGIERINEPITMGLPFPRGILTDATQLSLRDATGVEASLQVAVTDRWPDGSIKWALFDFLARVPANSSVDYVVTVDEATRPSARNGSQGILIEETDHAFQIHTGVASFRLDRSSFVCLSNAIVSDKKIPILESTRWCLTDPNGQQYTPIVTRCEVETSGTVRSTFYIEARCQICELFSRVSFFAGTSVVRCEVTIRNPHRAHHRGNFWDLGDAGSIYIKEFSLQVGLRGEESPSVLWSPALDKSMQDTTSADFELYQDSSGGENWDSLNHVDHNNQVPHQFCGYRARSNHAETHGKRANPIVAVFSENGGGIAGTVRHFWENFPKAIEVNGKSLAIALFPRQRESGHELQGGEQKSSVVFLSVFHDRENVNGLDWSRAPIVPHADPEWYASTNAIPYLIPRAVDQNRVYVELVDEAIKGDDSFFVKREKADEYGWRHFGDLPADHESAFYKGKLPFVSHYNNQYDPINGAFVHFLRSGDERWFRIMDDLARHVVDIDIYHTDEDRAAYNRGLFWFTDHYTHAFTSTHRTFSRLANGASGGPGIEHCFTSGLMNHYFLTGDPRSREAVLELSQWVMDADDGRKSRFRWLDSSPTGAASVGGGHNAWPGRGGGNAVNTMLDAFRLSGESKFLAKAEEIIRRCIHPHDNVAEMHLEDVEKHWSYTIFLCSVGKFLDFKIEQNEPDSMYAYAQAGLLNYSRWMADHEVLTLSRSTELEYPTETWPAQDMRKSDVFKYAAKHSRGKNRERFLERSQFFFETSIDQVGKFHTKTFTRPQVLMMAHGYMHAYFQAHQKESAPCIVRPCEFGKPIRFISQRFRVKLKLKRLCVIGALTIGASIAWWLSRNT